MGVSDNPHGATLRKNGKDGPPRVVPRNTRFRPSRPRTHVIAETNASAGNRARVTSMATMYSTTRPLMLDQPWAQPTLRKLKIGASRFDLQAIVRGTGSPPSLSPTMPVPASPSAPPFCLPQCCLGKKPHSTQNSQSIHNQHMLRLVF